MYYHYGKFGVKVFADVVLRKFVTGMAENYVVGRLMVFISHKKSY
jgi:hypothetical protein